MLERRRLAVHITPDAQRQIRGGSQWLFGDSITRIADGGTKAADGDLAVIYDKSRKFLAIGIYDKSSPIAVRVLHSGKPCTIDDEFFAQKFDDALALREPVLNRDDTEAFRVLHGENDGLGGLVADKYGPNLVLKLYSSAWIPWIPVFLDDLMAKSDTQNCILRLSRAVQLEHRDLEGTTLAGEDITAPVVFLENGLKLTGDLIDGQKTGHFLDQRDNRMRLRKYSNQKTVLDVFSCTGGFGLNAAVGGATEVTCTDRSAGAIELIKKNFSLNRGQESLGATVLNTIKGDAFEVLERLGQEQRTYGVVVVDPPSFTPNNSARRSALASYKRLNELAIKVLEPGGLLVSASCSARVTADQFFEAVESTLYDSGRKFEVVDKTFHADDHPIGFEFGSYLKAMFTIVQ